MSKAPIAVALDAPDLATAKEWAHDVAPYVQVMKVGLEVFLRDGHESVRVAQDASGTDVIKSGATDGDEMGRKRGRHCDHTCRAIS